ncbi:MAG: TetR/AcrR family transcriptional regulator [Rubrivivax sp.]|nr:MAG: TetR/AcrR family transcriptional regulator [Rubrivivax sp.]
MARVSFKQQVLQAREDAIVDAVNRLLAEKGFDLMTVDAVAAEVGIAKASLYKHFPSKEALAAEAMKRLLQRSLDRLAEIDAEGLPDAVSRLKAAVRWTMQVQLAGEMPSLPAQNSSLRTALIADLDYMNRLMAVSEQLGGWIVQAQQSGQLQASLPPEVILYTVFARACDPVLAVLKAGGHAHEQIIEWVMATCFEGLAAR